MSEFAGQVVLVTGASRGIGRATAVAFARAGARVVANYRADGVAARETAAVIEAAGGQVWLHRADVGEPDEVEALLAGVEREAGPLRVLVNNAAAFNRQPFLEVSLQELDRVWRTNVRGLFYLSQCAARNMAGRRQGCIIHLSSILAQQTVPARSVYSATKGAVESLTRAMALDLAPHGVRVNAVVPGLIRTQALLAGMPDPAVQAEIQQHIPGGRFGRPEETAAVILFLASDAASYVNGALLAVDGGLAAREAGPLAEIEADS